ncbi:uncharacterized protein LOC114722664 [Neltuma alba]|uniref:uncharacterized protein LOC114722664 n=1 Tax=Neltuma alba TaxID=207710 RepID=UPI0010A35028|nr:uncharacterized protein LOC114722664 [Prosopis alba]
MEPTAGKRGSLRNFLARLLLFGVFLLLLRFAYVITITGDSCGFGSFCFFSPSENVHFLVSGYDHSTIGARAVPSNRAVRSALRPELYNSREWIKGAQFYSSVFRNLISEGYLTPESKSLCVDTSTGSDVFTLKENGILDSIGISKKTGKLHRLPLGDNTFDFVFSGEGGLDKSARPSEFASEIARTLKPKGFVVFHVRANDSYSFNSFLDLFNCCRVVKSRDIDGFDSSLPCVREIVLRKESDGIIGHENEKQNSNGNCTVLGYKQELVAKAEPLIAEEPLKPWITLKRNIKNVKYLPSMVDISFKNRYVYVDVGARSYGSSIGSWFRKQYPKQNKTFHVYAIEADKTFHQEYGSKKGITLLPYAAWVKNETLTFEIHREPGKREETKGRGMGRIQPLQFAGDYDGEAEKIQGFDFAEWLKNTVSKNDFVVMKMDVEGAEFDLIPRLFETGAICLVDEIFLECHYNRWQRCCPGQRSSKYEKTYGQCLALFYSLRRRGVLVHQWW